MSCIATLLACRQTIDVGFAEKCDYFVLLFLCKWIIVFSSWTGGQRYLAVHRTRSDQSS